MKDLAAYLFGIVLAVLAPPYSWVMAVAGMIAGIAVGLAELRWPLPKQPYVRWSERPKQTTLLRQLVPGIGAFALGVFILLIFLPQASGLAPLLERLAYYIGGLALAGGAWNVATAKRSMGEHNNWLASMMAKPSRDSIR